MNGPSKKKPHDIPQEVVDEFREVLDDYEQQYEKALGEFAQERGLEKDDANDI